MRCGPVCGRHENLRSSPSTLRDDRQSGHRVPGGKAGPGRVAEFANRHRPHRHCRAWPAAERATPADPQIAKSLKYLEEYVQENGGIYTPGGPISTYETCIVLVCFQEANRDHRYDKTIRSAEKFIRGGQWEEKRGKDKSDPAYGGMGYGAKSRPGPLEHRLLGRRPEGLQRPGRRGHPAGLIFVSRCQNLEGEHNNTPFAAKVNDGGFYYNPTLSNRTTTARPPTAACEATAP